MKYLVTLLIAVMLLPLVALASKNPADYPLEIQILGVHRQRDRFGVVHGWGRGNINEGGSIHGFDYSYDGCPTLRMTPANLSYPGKWKKNTLRLDILVAEVGAVDKFQQCDLKTTVRTEVYVRGPAGGIRAIDPEQFKARREKRKAGRAQAESSTAASDSVPTGTESATSAAAPSEAKPKLEVVSEPDGADVEVDGDFMGSTPSVLEVDAGEHELLVRKAGYQDWKRKIKVAGGQVKVAAQLEKSTE